MLVYFGNCPNHELHGLKDFTDWVRLSVDLVSCVVRAGCKKSLSCGIYYRLGFAADFNAQAHANCPAKMSISAKRTLG